MAFGFEIVRPDRIAEAAFREVLEKIEQGTGFKPYLNA